MLLLKSFIVFGLACGVIYASDEGDVTEAEAKTSETSSVTSSTPTESGNSVMRMPPNLTLTKSSQKYIQIKWSSEETPIEYTVYYTEGISTECPIPSPVGSVVLASNTSEFAMRNLSAGTIYSVCIGSTYSDNTQITSSVALFNTSGYGGSANPCPCDRNVATLCNPTDGTCICEDPLRTGSKCTECMEGYFHHNSLESCEPCHCPEKVSNGSCYLSKDGVKMCHCVRNYMGTECKSCSPGYFFKAGLCIPCHCSQNTHPNSTIICKTDTGVCVDCYYNTTGDQCDRCAEGFVGYAHNRTCVPDTKTTSSHSKPHNAQREGPGTLGAVAVSLLLGSVLVVTAVGVIYYCTHHGRHRPLPWSVQLHDEDVNFSQLMEGQDFNEDPFGQRLKSAEQRLHLNVNGQDKVYHAVNA